MATRPEFVRSHTSDPAHRARVLTPEDLAARGALRGRAWTVELDEPAPSGLGAAPRRIERRRPGR